MENRTFHQQTNNLSPSKEDEYEVLDCGKPVNQTFYDDLIGVLRRHTVNRKLCKFNILFLTNCHCFSTHLIQKRMCL